MPNYRVHEKFVLTKLVDLTVKFLMLAVDSMYKFIFLVARTKVNRQVLNRLDVKLGRKRNNEKAH